MRLMKLLLMIVLFLTVPAGFMYGNQEKDKLKEEKTSSTQAGAATQVVSGSVAQRNVSTRDRVGNELQEGMDDKSNIFYSDAPMYVAPHEDAKEPTMFILGSAEFSNGAQIKQKGVTALTGDFLSSKYAIDENTEVKKLFLDPTADGVIRFMGQWNKQEIKRVPFSATHEVPKANAKLDHENYVLNFPKIEVQKEGFKTVGELDGLILSNTAKPYDPRRMGLVSVKTNASISAKELDITGGNRFSVDVYSNGLDEYGEIVSGDAAVTASNYYKVNSGYANLEKITGQGDSNAYPGHSEVNMVLYKYTEGQNDIDQAQSDPNVVATNTYSFKDDKGRDWTATFMRGMTSPFQKLRADYMFYHVLSKPGATGSITGANPDPNAPISNPRTTLEPGHGYFYAMDASSDYFNKIDHNWHDEKGFWVKRSRGGYELSRLLYEYDPTEADLRNPLSLYSIDKSFGPVPAVEPTEDDVETVSYEDQLFNVGNITVDLQASNGANVLANPYMAPISLSDMLVQKDGAGNYRDPATLIGDELTQPFDIGNVGNANGNVTVKAVHDATNIASLAEAAKGKYALIRPTYWVVNSGLLIRTTGGGTPMYSYNVKYDVVDYVMTAGTAASDADGLLNKVIEPMQMFLLHVAAPGQFVFNPGMIASKGERFEVSIAPKTNINANPRTRSISDDAYAEESKSGGVDIKDWFVVEASVKGEEITTDRTAVRFFSSATLGYEKQHDVDKKIRAKKQDNVKTKSSDNEILSESSFTPTNVIYTKASNGVELLSNAVGYGTKEIPLHYIPSEKEEEVSISVLGLDNLDRISGVWLIDKENNNYKQDLLQENSYTFVSKPIENALDAENRFILRFYDIDEDDESPSLTEKPITCYYSGSTLYVGGLNEKDLGSSVQIFDLQGRLMGATTVNNYPSIEYHKTLGQGTFIVRITGNRNYTTKFVNIQNY